MRKTFVFFTFIFTFCMMIQGTVVSTEQKIKESMLVTTDWLSDHLNDLSLIILNIGKKDEFELSIIVKIG